MTRWRAIVCLIAFLTPLTARAERRPEPGPVDPRIQSVVYDPQDVVLLEAPPEYQVTVQFAPDERIENVAVGNSAAWQVTPNKRGDNLFVKPVQPGVTTNMVVVTDARVYAFTLTPLFGPSATAPFVIRFRYPPAATAALVGSDAATVARPGRWRIHGDAAIRPKRIEDDGTHIAIAWADDAALPAIFAVDARGNESLVNGAMRDGAFVIDGLVERLVFRSDRRTASARRLPQKTRK